MFYEFQARLLENLSSAKSRTYFLSGGEIGIYRFVLEEKVREW
jgi:hypothetical protein